MNAYYQLVLQRPLAGFAQELFLPELYRQQRRLDPLLLTRGQLPIRHFVCPQAYDEAKGEWLDCWFDAQTGWRLVHGIVSLIHGSTLDFTRRDELLSELFALGERLDVARMGGIHWQLGLELEFA
ncbi:MULTISPECIES: hypothetical protein [Pseudomonadaceae]|uniref:Uncharacterized protein n=1 Tax=Pseudomonas denitrificans TaxID=43306 RepID=A0A9X7MW36_PSEDE|nr:MULTISPECIES: hypothetical protein [Pseudomonadaceae]MBD9628562.1 hypothetical protein [Pseudomonas sp. PDM19]QEY70787.1 hypothetical protein F1C79_03515 [Pseudomonas denitrificans (nom. rej.)]